MPTSTNGLACPAPASTYPHVLLAHGGGGRLMRRLIEEVFVEGFEGLALQAEHDAALLQSGAARLAFTTDAFVVHPLAFPGGDIGTLAVYGTVNDLAMAGARPCWLSASFILEEGLPIETLRSVVASMRRTAEAADVLIVTGDTKVVDRGKADGLFITTAGIGLVEHDRTLGPRSIRPGDAVLLSGDVGRHGIAIMAVREGLSFETTIESDAAPLNAMVIGLLDAGLDVHALRDLTRGGLASALNEIASTAGLGIRIDERHIPVDDAVRGACELLGLDPLYVANEGRLVAFVPAAEADAALNVLRRHPAGAGTCRIGEVTPAPPGRVTLTGALGIDRVLDLLSGEQLPRIC